MKFVTRKIAGSCSATAGNVLSTYQFHANSVLLVLVCCTVMLGCQNLASDYHPQREPAVGAVEQNWVHATGYAPISLQPGATAEQKQLNAMRVSRLRAYQELAAIVNGQYLYGTTTVESMILQNDGFKTAVAGVVRGARVVKSFQFQNDVYATTLEVDLNQVERAWVSTN